MAAVAYVRTSSTTNVGEDKDSKARQMLAIKQYAASNSLEISDDAVFADEGISGTVPLVFRRAWRKLMEHCEQSGVRTVIFEDSSRFARDLMIQEQGCKELLSQGYTLISAASPGQFLPNSAEATLVRQLLGSIAQFQRDSATLRLAGARLRSAETQNKLSVLTGKRKTQGCKSRLEGPDAEAITNIMTPWVQKGSLHTGDLQKMCDALDKNGIKSVNGKKLSKATVQKWFTAMSKA
jgi:DNA invertase Pin-like site-specific DNA recombinase